MTELHDIKGTGVSTCCGAGTYGPNLICENCGEHCDNEESTEALEAQAEEEKRNNDKLKYPHE